MKTKKSLSVLAVTAVVLMLAATLFVGAGAAQEHSVGTLSELQSAISTATSGDTIIITADIAFGPSDHISITKPLTIKGDGDVTLRYDDLTTTSTGQTVFELHNGAEGTVIQDLTFELNCSSPDDSAIYLREDITNSSVITIKNVTFRGNAASKQNIGILSTNLNPGCNGGNLSVENCTFTGYLKYGIYMNNVNSIVVNNSLFKGPGRFNAIQIDETADCLQSVEFTGNTLDEFTDTWYNDQYSSSIYVGGNPSSVKISDNAISTLHGFKPVIFGANVASPVLSGNTYVIGGNLSYVVGIAGNDEQIKLSDDLDLTEQVTVSKPVTIDGQYHTIKVKEGTTWATDDSHKYLLLVSSNTGAVTLKNLSFDGYNGATNTAFGVQFWNTGALNQHQLLNTVINGSKGMSVKVGSANVSITNLTTQNAAWGIGIDVEASGSAPATGSNLTIDTLATIGDQMAISDEGPFESTPREAATVTIADGNYVKDQLSDRYYWTVPAAQIGDTKYATLEKAVAASKTGDTITLLKNIAATTQIEIADKEIVLDLNGNEISYVNSTTLPSGVLLVHNGAGLTINDTIGSGAIDSGTNAYAAIALTKKGDDNSSAAKLTVNGGTLRGYYYAICGNGNRDNTEITINGGVIMGTCENDSTAIYHPQNGTLTINGGALSGATGLYIKSGDLAFTKFNGGIITGIGSKQAYVTTGDGFKSTGDALTIDTCGYPGGDPSVSIEDGNFTSAYASAVGSYAKAGKTALKQFITGGQFSDASVSNYTAAGYCAIKNDISGYYDVVAGSEPTIVIKPVQNGTATDIPITPSGNTNVTVNESLNSVVLQDNITNVAVVYTFDEMTKTADKVTGEVAEINAVYPEMNASEDVLGTVTTPVSLILGLNKSLVGDIVLPKIDTEYNTSVADRVSNTIATITGLPNGGQTLDQINSNITEVTMTFKNIPAPGSGHRYVAYHVTDSEIEAVKYWNENMGGDLQFTSTKGFSSYVLASETVNHYVPSSSSKQSGSSQILSEGQVAPTPYQTVAPTAKPTEKPATPVVNPTTKATTESTQQSPAPFFGILAGLGAAALVLKLRK